MNLSALSHTLMYCRCGFVFIRLAYSRSIARTSFSCRPESAMQAQMIEHLIFDGDICSYVEDIAPLVNGFTLPRGFSIYCSDILSITARTENKISLTQPWRRQLSRLAHPLLQNRTTCLSTALTTWSHTYIHLRPRQTFHGQNLSLLTSKTTAVQAEKSGWLNNLNMQFITSDLCVRRLFEL